MWCIKHNIREGSIQFPTSMTDTALYTNNYYLYQNFKKVSKTGNINEAVSSFAAMHNGFSIIENPYMHSSKVTDCLLYVTFFTYLSQILVDGSCLYGKYIP